ncbi:MAG: Lrp/AsnC family transcriptional regulator [Candidatus Thorarchaeota archaeon]
MIKIDKLDRKIIAELDMNARIPITKLAKSVRASREVVNYRIKTLTRKGIISGTQTFFNPAKIGYTIYRILIRLDSLDEEKINRFQKYFIENEKVMWFAKLGSKWDYIIELFAKNADEFKKLFDKALMEFEKDIGVYEIMVILEIKGYNRKYIYDNKKPKEIIIGGKIENLNLDKIDLKIINFLKKSSQITNTEIGEKLNLSRNTIKGRIKKLEEGKLITGHKLFYHPQKIGFQSYKLLISMNNLDSQKEVEFFNFSQQNKNIIFTHRNLGKWNYELEIEIDDLNELQKIIVELRTKFKGFILDYELFPILEDYKINLFPN